MATREDRFRQAAWTYFVYGVLYWLGGAYLELQGLGRLGPTPGRYEWMMIIALFLLGTLFIVLFPWLIARGARGWGYLWFTRVLTLLVAFRAFGVGRVMLRPSMPTVPLPGGGDIPMGLGAGTFFLITLATMAMLARAAWSRRE